MAQAGHHGGQPRRWVIDVGGGREPDAGLLHNVICVDRRVEDASCDGGEAGPFGFEGGEILLMTS
jgi:hypothetical protein